MHIPVLIAADGQVVEVVRKVEGDQVWICLVIEGKISARAGVLQPRAIND